MGRTETGEFELVLGNRQVLSGLAIVAILFGVFFAMGYIVGRNSTPAARVAASAEGPSSPGEAFRPQAGSRPVPPAPAPESPAAGGQTQPSAEGASQPGSTARPPVTTQPAPEAQAPPKSAETAPAPPAVDQESGATYLQVMAVKRSEAEVVVKSLQDKGFRALMAPSSKDGIFRVLVGPFKDASTLGKSKSDLENLGFHPFVQK